MSMDSIIEVYHVNIMLIATKHIADNNFVFFSKTAQRRTCMQHSPNLLISLFQTYHPTAQSLVIPTE